MVAVYQYLTDSGPKPRWLQAGDYIDAFGAQAVFGRVLGVHEMNAMIAAHNLREAFKSREKYRDKDGAANWVEWGVKYPDEHDLLTRIEIAAGQEDG